MNPKERLKNELSMQRTKKKKAFCFCTKTLGKVNAPFIQTSSKSFALKKIIKNVRKKRVLLVKYEGENGR